jgi:hypothetical protein
MASGCTESQSVTVPAAISAAYADQHLPDKKLPIGIRFYPSFSEKSARTSDILIC